MKFKTTKKEMKQGYVKILSIGYCNLQNLLYYTSPIAYSSGSNGWCCDYYDIDNVCISTGYSPIGKTVNYDIIEKYDNQASEIIGNYNISHEERKKKVNDLLLQFIQEA